MATLINKFIQSPCSGQSSALLSPIPSAGRAPRHSQTINIFPKHYLRRRGIHFRDKSGRFENKLLLKNTKIDVRPACKRRLGIVATLTTEYTPDKSSDPAITSFTSTYPLRRTVKVDGKITVKLDSVSGDGKLRLILECDLPGRWVLHWGVAYSDDPNSEWDQPPPDMTPPGSVLIKDYAAQTPLARATSPMEGKILYRVQIGINNNDSIAAIFFVLKEEDTGTWYNNNGEDFRVHLAQAIPNGFDKHGDGVGLRRQPGILDRMSGIFLNPKESPQDVKVESVVEGDSCSTEQADGVCQEYKLSKETLVENFLTVSVQKNKERKMSLVSFDTDLPGDVILHWGVCKDDARRWEILLKGQCPPNTIVYRKRALQTSLQRKENGNGSWAVLCIDDEHSGLLFVLKHKDSNNWLNNMGDDFYVPLTAQSRWIAQTSNGYEFPRSDVHILDWTLKEQLELETKKEELGRRHLANVLESESMNETGNLSYKNAASILLNKELKSLVDNVSAEHSGLATQEKLLQEIEKLAAVAYNSFKDSPPLFTEELDPGVKVWKPKGKPCSGTGSGNEVVLQGFNWESHRSGRWYNDLSEKADEIASWGFTIVWLPPPTDSVSPEGYMPCDLYNLNSRYGSMEELKKVVKRFHDVGVKVLGDAVLNHRCAQYQNHNGIWNIFGGQLNWDDRAIVSDDPHFQGRGNKSSGDNFHAAPNIDHSQEFVRRDLIEWMRWLRSEIGYDGWRLDFVRGFWGGYVKDYLEGTEPDFAVGEYWDSLSYTYGQMEHNQDAHRQRVIDWINATGGNAGAFDVTTKGILHTTLEKCEYWRLADHKRRPPGVVGWWPSRAVTFIENHDTGSTQGHWRFPAGKEIQGYAYILTHPGTPTVFYDHMFSHNRDGICALIALRKRAGIHCRSVVHIEKAERDVYVAKIDERVIVKIGPGHYEPPNNPSKFVVATEGQGYKVWEAS